MPFDPYSVPALPTKAPFDPYAYFEGEDSVGSKTHPEQPAPRDDAFDMEAYMSDFDRQEARSRVDSVTEDLSVLRSLRETYGDRIHEWDDAKLTRFANTERALLGGKPQGPEQLERLRRKTIGDTDLSGALNFFGAKTALDFVGLRDTIQRAQGDPNDPTTLDAIADFQERQLDQERGGTLGYKIGEGVVQTLPFMAEMAATGPLAGAFRGVALKGAERVGAKTLTRYAAKLAEREASKVGLTALQQGLKYTAGVPGRMLAHAVTNVPAAAALESLPTNLKLNADEQGNLQALFDDPERGFASNYFRNFLSQGTEVWSEGLGGALMAGPAKLLGPVKRWIAKASPERMNRLGGAWLAHLGGKADTKAGFLHGVNRSFKAMQLGNFGEEWLEEDAGHLMQFLLDEMGADLGVETPTIYGDPEQMAVRAGVLALPQAGRGALRMGAGALDGRALPETGEKKNIPLNPPSEGGLPESTGMNREQAVDFVAPEEATPTAGALPIPAGESYDILAREVGDAVSRGQGDALESTPGLSEVKAQLGPYWNLYLAEAEGDESVALRLFLEDQQADAVQQMANPEGGSALGMELPVARGQGVSAILDRDAALEQDHQDTVQELVRSGMTPADAEAEWRRMEREKPLQMPLGGNVPPALPPAGPAVSAVSDQEAPGGGENVATEDTESTEGGVVDRETGFGEPQTPEGSTGEQQTKPPWEMTYDELRNALTPSDIASLRAARPLFQALYPEELSNPSDPWGIKRAVEKGDEIPRVPMVLLSQKHRQAITEALARGENIPRNVLADYPDLAAPPTPTVKESLPVATAALDLAGEIEAGLASAGLSLAEGLEAYNDFGTISDAAEDVGDAEVGRIDRLIGRYLGEEWATAPEGGEKATTESTEGTKKKRAGGFSAAGVVSDYSGPVRLALQRAANRSENASQTIYVRMGRRGPEFATQPFDDGDYYAVNSNATVYRHGSVGERPSGILRDGKRKPGVRGERLPEVDAYGNPVETGDSATLETEEPVSGTDELAAAGPGAPTANEAIAAERKAEENARNLDQLKGQKRLLEDKIENGKNRPAVEKRLQKDLAQVNADIAEIERGNVSPVDRVSEAKSKFDAAVEKARLYKGESIDKAEALLREAERARSEYDKAYSAAFPKMSAFGQAPPVAEGGTPAQPRPEEAVAAERNKAKVAEIAERMEALESGAPAPADTTGLITGKEQAALTKEERDKWIDPEKDRPNSDAPETVRVKWAIEALGKQIAEAKAAIDRSKAVVDDWSNRTYKGNKDVIGKRGAFGGDEGTTQTVGDYNEKRRRNTINNANRNIVANEELVDNLTKQLRGQKAILEALLLKPPTGTQGKSQDFEALISETFTPEDVDAYLAELLDETSDDETKRETSATGKEQAAPADAEETEAVTQEQSPETPQGIEEKVNPKDNILRHVVVMPPRVDKAAFAAMKGRALGLKGGYSKVLGGWSFKRRENAEAFRAAFPGVFGVGAATAQEGSVSAPETAPGATTTGLPKAVEESPAEPLFPRPLEQADRADLMVGARELNLDTAMDALRVDVNDAYLVLLAKLRTEVNANEEAATKLYAEHPTDAMARRLAKAQALRKEVLRRGVERWKAWNDAKPADIAEAPSEPESTPAAVPAPEAPAATPETAAAPAPAIPVKQPTSDRERPGLATVEEASPRLEDAGEKIGGARKDVWASRGLEVSDLTGMTDAEQFEHVTKPNVWPRPDYGALIEGGMEPEAAFALKTIYDHMALRPEDSAEAREDFIAVVRMTRRLGEQARTVKDVKEIQHALYEALIPESARASRGISTADSRRYHGATKANARQHPARLPANIERRAQAAIAKGWPAKTPAWLKGLDIKGKEGDFFLAKGYRILKSGFATREEAEAFAKARYEDLSEKEKMPVRPHLDHVQRTGADIRNGQDVGSDAFIESFGFRGVEFGNWVASDERQKSVNMAFDGLHDLANALGVPPEALSLDGALALAFGARGHGGRAAAHYEPGRLVINLTKLSGAGTLAHEWAHAMDHYFGKMGRDLGTAGKMEGESDVRARSMHQEANLRPELQEAFDAILKVMFKRNQSRAEAIMEVEQALEKLRSDITRVERDLAGAKDRKIRKQLSSWLEPAIKRVPVLERRLAEMRSDAAYDPNKPVTTSYSKTSVKLGKYWERPHEMFARAFEAYVEDRIAASGEKSQYLVHGTANAALYDGTKGNPYPADLERDAINGAFARFFEEVKLRVGESGKATMYSLNTTGRNTGGTVQGVTVGLLRGKHAPKVKGLLDSGRLVVVQTAADLPGGATAIDVGGRAAAAYDPKTDTMYLVADHVEPGTEDALLMHEAFHRTVARGELKALLDELRGLEQDVRNNQDVPEWFERARLAARSDEGTPQYYEEIGAYAVQEVEGAPASIRAWVEKILARVKAVLFRTLGVRVGKLDPAFLRAVAVSGLRGEGATENAESTKRFSAGTGDTRGTKDAGMGEHSVKAFHGSPDGRITGAFQPDEFGYVFATPNRDTAENYSNATSRSKQFAGWTPHVTEVRLRMGKTLDLTELPTRRTRFGDEVVDLSGLPPDLQDALGEGIEEGEIRAIENADAAQELRAAGYESVIGYGADFDGLRATEYVVLDSSQIKSADPVTYDDAGNVIPLSERFNEDNDDIRYSREGGLVSRGLAAWLPDSEVLAKARKVADVVESVATEESRNAVKDLNPIAKVLMSPQFLDSGNVNMRRIYEYGQEQWPEWRSRETWRITHDNPEDARTNALGQMVRWEKEYTLGTWLKNRGRHTTRETQDGVDIVKKTPMANAERTKRAAVRAREVAQVTRYLLQRDIDQEGYRVKEKDGSWLLLSPADEKGKRREVGRYDSEMQAEAAMIEAEAIGLTQYGFTDGQVEYVRNLRKMTLRTYHHLEQYVKKLIDAIPGGHDGVFSISVEDNGKMVKQEFDIFAALREMGDLRGSFFPRVRPPGKFVLVATKRNKQGALSEPKILRRFDTLQVRNFHAKRYESQGYTVDRVDARDISPDTRADMNLLALNDVVIATVERMSGGAQVPGFHEYGFTGGVEQYTKKDGSTEEHFVVRGQISKAMKEEVFKKRFGMRSFSGEPGVWRRVQPPADFEGRLLAGMADFTNQRNTAMEFLHNFAGELAQDLHATGSRATQIGRKGVKGAEEVYQGYETNPSAAMGSYVTRTVGGTAKTRMIKLQLAAYTGHYDDTASFDTYIEAHLPDDVKAQPESKEYRDAVEALYGDYEVEVRKRRIDERKTPERAKYAKDYMRHMARNDGRAERLVGIVRNITGVKYLSGMATGLVNLTALATSVPGVAQGMEGIKPQDTMRHYGDGAKLMLTHMRNQKDEGPPIADEEMHWLFMEMHRNGWLDAQLQSEAFGQMYDTGQRHWREMSRLLTFGIGVTEPVNRALTLHSFYLNLKEKYPDWDRTQVLRRAHEMSDKAHGVYNKGDLPAWAQGGGWLKEGLRSWYMFKKFPGTYIDMMYTLARGPLRDALASAIVRDKDGFVTALTGPEAKGLAWMALSPVVLSGAAVWPFLLHAMAALIPGWSPDDPEEEFYRWVGQWDPLDGFLGLTPERLARSGVVGLTGFNIKGSLAFDFDIPRNRWEAFGAPGSAMEDFYRGAGELSQGNILRGVESIAPRIAAAPIRAFRERREGVTARNNQPIFEGNDPLRPDLLSTMIRALGFNPAAMSEKSERAWSDRKIEMEYGERRTDILSKVRRMLLDKKRGAMDDADWLALRSEILAYNERVSDKGLDFVPMITTSTLRGVMTRAGKAPLRERIRAGETRERKNLVTEDTTFRDLER